MTRTFGLANYLMVFVYVPCAWGMEHFALKVKWAAYSKTLGIAHFVMNLYSLPQSSNSG
jgi:hypothetical protein